MTASGAANARVDGFDARVVPRRPPVDLQLDEDGQLALYHRAAGLVVLNGGAAAIWEQCDGSTSLGAIVERLGAAFSTDRNDLELDVWATYAHLVGLGLLEDAGERPVSSGRARGCLGRSG